MCSVGMMLEMYLLPTDVSFHAIKVAEGGDGENDDGGIGTGSQEQSTGDKHPRWENDASVLPGNIIKGSGVESPDKAGSVALDFAWERQNLNVGAGTFTWSIPWDYTYDIAGAKNPVTQRRFTTVTHYAEFDGQRGARVSKAGNSVQHTVP